MNTKYLGFKLKEGKKLRFESILKAHGYKVCIDGEAIGEYNLIVYYTDEKQIDQIEGLLSRI